MKATFQVLGNLKIVTTGVLSYLFLNRSLTTLRWCALFLVTVGAMTTQLAAGGARGGRGGRGGGLNVNGASFSAPWKGYVLGLADACCSAAGAVYTEFLMKRNDDTIHWQNVQMYSFGLLFNVVRLTGEDVIKAFGAAGGGEAADVHWVGIDGEGMLDGSSDGSGGGGDYLHDDGAGDGTEVDWLDWRRAVTAQLWFTRVFEGHGVFSTLVVLNLACAGLLISYVLKYVDAVAKVFATSMAMFITPLLSYVLFHKGLSLPMYLGVFTAACGINMYYMSPRVLLGHDQVLADDPDLARRELMLSEK